MDIKKENANWLKSFINEIQDKIQTFEVNCETKDLKPISDSEGKLWSRSKPTGKYTITLITE